VTMRGSAGVAGSWYVMSCTAVPDARMLDSHPSTHFDRLVVASVTRCEAVVGGAASAIASMTRLRSAPSNHVASMMPAKMTAHVTEMTASPTISRALMRNRDGGR